MGKVLFIHLGQSRYVISHRLYCCGFRHPRRYSWSRRWRSRIAGYLVAALMLPALGPSLWLLAGTAGDTHTVAHHADVDGHVGHVHLEGHDHSDVPGSPTHPADHDCAACQLLAQLARCCATPSQLVTQPLSVISIVATRPARAPIRMRIDVALPPPSRAPPFSSVHPA